jgi:primase-polymerase (primpol)-like protein
MANSNSVDNASPALAYPGPTPEDLLRMPAVLKTLPQWVLWQLLEAPNASGELKLNKVPINPRTLHGASSTDPKTWATYDACVAALSKARTTWAQRPPTSYNKKPATYQGAGLGFVFTAADAFMLVDLDNSLDPATGHIAAWAQSIVETLQSYTQRSVSGAGLHVLVAATLPTADKQHGNVQMWDQARFVAMTGWHLPGTLPAIEARQSQLTMVHAAHILMPKAQEAHQKAQQQARRPQAQTRTATAGGPPVLTDQEIVDKLRQAKNSAKFAALWSGDKTGYTSQSEADLALLDLLAFYTKDPAQLDALFRQSGLCDTKWTHRQGYRDKTITKALQRVTEHYDPEAYITEQTAFKQRSTQDARRQQQESRPESATTRENGLSSLNSLSSQNGKKSEDPVMTSEEALNSLYSLNSPSSVSLREEAYHGVAGALVRLISPETEANDAALLLQFLTYFGAVAGRHAFYVVGATKHYPNLFAVLVGPTAKGRKGTAYDHVEALMLSVDTSWSQSHVIGGCGSGEGLIHAVRDPVIKREPVKTKGKTTGYEDVLSDAGVVDKRLLVYEPEFASVLKVVSRDGNILSMTLRQAWESGRLQNTVKTSPQKATNAHIAVIGHITTDELQALLTTTEAANGFGNRFLWIGVKRTKSLPDGGALDRLDMRDVHTKLIHARQAAATITRMSRDADATRAWHAVYDALSTEHPGLAGGLLARSEAQVLRLSMLYALLDASAVIRPAHLYAALAVWEYAEASVQTIFGTTTGNKDADTLREAPFAPG